jgi:hypothetical protein
MNKYFHKKRSQKYDKNIPCDCKRQAADFLWQGKVATVSDYHTKKTFREIQHEACQTSR